jgi:outer membrane protein assembly factor BamB
MCSFFSRLGPSLTVLALAAGSAGSTLAQTDGSLRWGFTTLSTATAGTIVSSPAVGADGTVYMGVEVGTATSSAPSGRLFALKPDGSPKWANPFNAPDWVDSTPAVGADGTVYFGCWNGYLYALRPDGTKLWEFKAGSFVASSPALGTDGTIYVGAGSNLIAVNPDGTLKWSYPAADWIDSSPAVGPDGTVYVGSWDNNLYAIGPDGAEKWRFMTDDNVSTSPAIAADGSVYFGSRDVKVYALNPNGTLRWSFDTGDTIEASPVLGPDGTVYVGTNGGRLFALNRNGTERWRYPAANQPALAPLTSTAAVRADGSIVFGSSNNAVYALRADGTLLWRTALGDATDSSPVVAPDGMIYIGAADKKIYALNGTVASLATDWTQFRRDPQRTAWQPIGEVPQTTGRLINLSVRTFSGVNENTLIVGFVVGGSGARSLLLRGVGPTLSSFGVSGVLGNPQLTAFTGSTVMAVNDDWGTAANAGSVASTASSVGAFALPSGSLDAALLTNFSAGGYTVQVAGVNAGTGVALMEAYDAGGAGGARLVNVSARSAVSAGSGVLIAGFVVNAGSRAVLIRGIGPALTGFGVAGALTNPQLKIFQGSRLVAENNDWSIASNAASIAGASQRVGAFALSAGSQDAAILVTLPPNAYTAQVSGVGAATGVALIEVYELP